MKILIIRNSPDKVDFNNVTYNRQETGLAKALNRKGHKCDLAYFGGNEQNCFQYTYDGDKSFTIYLMRGLSILKNGIFYNADKLIGRYDIVQVGGYDQIQSWLLSRKYSDKMVVYNGTYYSDFNKGYNRKCKIIDRIFVPRYIKKKTTFITKNEMSASFLRSKGINDIVPVGVGLDTDQLSIFQQNSSDFSDQLVKIHRDTKLLLYVGKMEARRNIHFLFDVFAATKKRYPNLKLVMVSSGNEEYVKSCFNHAKSLGVYEDIIRIEKLEQKYLTKVYQACDLFLLPTIYEIFGMVLLEAMYFKLPVVTSLNGGSDILIKDRGTGVIVEKFDTDEWASSIVELLQKPEQCAMIGEKASSFISNEFTWDALSEKFLKVYRRVSQK